MKNTISYKYRLRYTIIGLFLPPAIFLSAFLAFAIPVLYILWYPSYSIIMIPGELVQGTKYLRIALSSIFWGTAGFILGYAKDRRVAAEVKNIEHLNEK